MSTNTGIAGTVFDLYGSGFTNASAVVFNAWGANYRYSASYLVESDSDLQVTVPLMRGSEQAAITVVTPQGATITLPSNVIQVTGSFTSGSGSQYYWVRNGGNLDCGSGGSETVFVDSGGIVTNLYGGMNTYVLQTGATLHSGSGGENIVYYQPGATITGSLTTVSVANAQPSILTNLFQYAGDGAIMALSNVSNATIITGGTASFGMTIGNSAAAGFPNLNYTVSTFILSGSATLGSVIPATGSLAPGTSQSCTLTATSTSLGDTTIYVDAYDPYATNGSQYAMPTLTVLGHTAPIVSVANGNNQTVIVGATGITAGLSLSNGTLNQGGLASLDVNSLGTGVHGSTGGALVASGSSQPYTATLSTTTLGSQTQTFSMNVGDDATLSGASAPMNLSTTATLTVLDHSTASLSSSATQTTQTISFGNVLRGATIPSQNFTIYNRAVNTSAAYTANLKLTPGFTTTGDGALTTTLATFNGLTPTNGTTCTASLNTSNYTTTGLTTIAMSASQLADDSTAPGAGNNNNGGITITLQGNVGNATADASNVQTSFGPALTAPVAQNGSYANLESKATATTGSGGYSMVGSIATILAGTNSGSAQTVSMQWRTQTQAERTGPGLLSDVVALTGMTFSGDETSPFVLQMTYNTSLLPLGPGSEGVWASNQRLYLVCLDDGEWENAVSGNIGSSNDDFVGVGAWSGDTALGDWGVNTSNHTVWAVVNYDGDFAVVPEPSSLVLLGAGAAGVLGLAWRRRLANRAAKPTVCHQGEENSPAILAFPSHQVKVVRRAA